VDTREHVLDALDVAGGDVAGGDVVAGEVAGGDGCPAVDGLTKLPSP
jgi:hypothetical protein